jgi:hypothetical protein
MNTRPGFPGARLREAARARRMRLRWPSPSMAIAITALFFSLAGTGYAVSKLPKNSVTSYQVKDRSLLGRDFKQGQLPRGPRGERGLEGTPGVAGAKGDKGDPGSPWTLNNGQFPGGKTLRGVFATAATAVTGGDIAQEAISFGFSMTTNPIPHYIPTGANPPPECPGTVNTPDAQPGHLCLWESTAGNVSSMCVFNPVNDSCGHSAVRGFGVLIVASSSGDFWAQGAWAATAP